jgi:signal transduction histidine kinase
MQSFPTGTTLSAVFDNNRGATNSPNSFLNPTLNSYYHVALQQQLLAGFGFGPNLRYLRIAKNNQKISDAAFKLQVMTTVTQIANMLSDSFNSIQSRNARAMLSSVDPVVNPACIVLESVGCTGMAFRIGSSRFFVSAFLINSSWNWSVAFAIVRSCSQLATIDLQNRNISRDALLWQHTVERSIQLLLLLLFAVSLLTEQITPPCRHWQTSSPRCVKTITPFALAAAEGTTYLAIWRSKINALAALLQSQRAGSLEAMALVERVMNSMPSPVLAFDPEGKLKLLNTAAERAFGLRAPMALGKSAEMLKLKHLLDASDDDLLSLDGTLQATRWVVKRSSFRLRGVPHVLLVLSDVSAALHEEERTAWKRLIRVLGHEINNSLTPIKSIAGSLRGRLASLRVDSIDGHDFEGGLEVIEDRAESLNRFLQAYRQLMGLPAPRLAPVSLAMLVERVVRLETRVNVVVMDSPDVALIVDADQIQQALINLTRNAAEAALSADMPAEKARINLAWENTGREIVIAILDNGEGLMNADNLFVPFYTTKPTGTGIGLALAQQIA